MSRRDVKERYLKLTSWVVTLLFTLIFSPKFNRPENSVRLFNHSSFVSWLIYVEMMISAVTEMIAVISYLTVGCSCKIRTE